MFRCLIVDPGDIKWEQTCPGALYVALSRAKTMGTFTSDTSFSLDSAIYGHGCGISTTRILEGHKKDNSIKGAPKVKYVLVAKRDHWVHYLGKRAKATVINVLTDSDKEGLMTIKLSQADVKEHIATIITAPNDSWAQRKKTCKIPHTRKLLWAVCMIYFSGMFIHHPTIFISNTGFLFRHTVPNTKS